MDVGGSIQFQTGQVQPEIKRVAPGGPDQSEPPKTLAPVGPGLPPAGSMVMPKDG
jgi:hypothetical protein